MSDKEQAPPIKRQKADKENDGVSAKDTVAVARSNIAAAFNGESSGNQNVASTATKVTTDINQQHEPATPDEIMTKLLLSDFQRRDKTTVRRALETMISLFPNPEQFASLGGYTLLRLSMKQWIYNSEIQILILTLLANVTSSDELSHTRPFVQLGMFAQALTVTVVNTAHEHVVDAAFYAIADMVCGSYENVAHIVDVCGGIETTIAAMKRYQDSCNVQISCTMVLSHVSKYIQYRAPIILAGGIQAIGNAMQGFPCCECLQEEAWSTLQHLTSARIDF
ncbi:hypothetical protein MPSEU_000869700 [Mayamaea pseudoterrestris]|nr:hypothetical protein MPSEU_000869700 [Mayamaea pseudoterrestris]